MKKLAHLLLILPLLYGCTKTDPKEALVRIGNKTFSKVNSEAFDRVCKMYPTEMGNYYPGFRSQITQLVETEIIYNQVPASFRDSLKASADWKLQQQYYPAQLFLMDFLAANLGIPDDKISSFYEANKDSFKVTVANDSTKKDSTYYRPLSEVKGQIIDTLFIRANKPDSTFLSRFDSTSDDSYIKDQWLSFVRQTLPQFFMKKIFAEVNGKPYPDSLSEIFGEGKYITKADFDVIMGWIPEMRQEQYKTPEGQRGLVEWLVKWKLFSTYAQNKGLTNPALQKNIMDWAWKCNVVFKYTNLVLSHAAEAAVKIDTAMLLYSYYDDNGYTTIKPTDIAFTSKLRSYVQEQSIIMLDSIIMGYRQKTPVTFLQNDFKDAKNQKPDSLMKVADALRDSGKTGEAKDIYLTLTKEFGFTPEGKSSLIELAKLQTEQQLYIQAISSYRRYLISNGDADKRCNTFFMIGFIYDEYLEKPLHAEANYKWVLKNTPDCELADDAEFMMLHLNEPMSSVEELRDEATRQGRKVETADTTVADTTR